MSESLQDRIMKVASDATLSEYERTLAIQRIYNESRAGSNGQTVNGTETQQVPECTHYDRHCDIIAKCCGKRFGCRVCHDEFFENDHKIDRFKTELMVCKLCGLQQPVGRCCANEECAWKDSHYYCGICRLWTNDSTKVFHHCDGCGLCRVGRRELLRHCDTCKLCFPLEIYNDHKCIDSGEPCSICGEIMHDSRTPVTLLGCGHGMHQHCLDAAFRHNLVGCPLCRKTCSQVDRAGVRAQIEAFQTPDELKDHICVVECNDCNRMSMLNFSFYPICPFENCQSFNTSRFKLYKSLAEAEADATNVELLADFRSRNQEEAAQATDDTCS